MVKIYAAVIGALATWHFALKGSIAELVLAVICAVVGFGLFDLAALAARTFRGKAAAPEAKR